MMRGPMIVATWNVLHRIHAVNWETPALSGWRDEAARIDAIHAMVAGWVADGADVVCLQEVSGDLVEALRTIPETEVHAFAYARVPSYWRRTEPPTLRAPEEYLVVIVRGTGGRVVVAEAFETDPGKGLLAVALADGTLVVSTHVSHDRRRAAQLARIASATREAPGGVVVCGDFNAERDRCAPRLGDGFVCAVPGEGSLPTRPREKAMSTGELGRDIDHVFVRGFTVRSTEVIDAAHRSDHNPVRVVLESSP